MSEDSPIHLKPAAERYTLKDVYNNLVQCRNVEISNLWQRAVMLGSFMIVFIAGYGGLWSAFLGAKGFDGKWILLHCGGVFISILGLMFSCLWIWMMKGSLSQQLLFIFLEISNCRNSKIRKLM